MVNLKLNSNMLKIIAGFAVIFDHIAVYFYQNIPTNMYVIFRIIGRMAMPIFAYLIVQGFFHTKNLNKYVKRLFIAGVVTEILMLLLYTLNNFLLISYKPSFNVLEENIIITFAISLIVMKSIDNIIEKKIKKEKINKQDIILIIFSLILISSYFFVSFDYSYKLLVYIIMMYVIEKIREKKNISKDIYFLLHFTSMIIFIIIYNSIFECFAIFSLIFIFLYSGERGKKSKSITFMFYSFYPIQHFTLYLLAMLLTM